MKRTLLPFLPLISSSLLLAEGEYSFGHGYQVGDLPLYIGGYASIEYQHARSGESRLDLDELAIMLYGEKDRLSYMVEIEAEDVYSEVFGDETAEETNEHFYLERFYLAYAFDDEYSIKAGKYNSPVGIWNKMPINVLRDTVSDPIITEMLFPKLTSGLELEYQSVDDSQVTFNLFAQYNDDIDRLYHEKIDRSIRSHPRSAPPPPPPGGYRSYNNYESDRHIGIGGSMEQNGVFYQLNAGYFRLREGEEYSYMLGAFSYEESKEKYQGELGFRFHGDAVDLPYIGYLQWTHSFDPQYQSIVRVEGYRDIERDEEDSLLVLGFTYRPYYPVALKAEYQLHSMHDESEFELSLSVLF